MSARRQVLEDSSDESESGDVGSSDSTFKFLTEDQVNEIEDCNIKSDGDGTYSDDAMDLAISQNEANLVQLEDDQSAHKYQEYQVLKDKVESFLAKPIWKRSGDPSEEVLLLEIEALRRSSKRTKINMFKHNGKTGGQVMFGPWWNYALQRIVQISSDKNTGDALDWEKYTACRILLSLFAFVTESTDVVKKGKLADLKSTFGVDWDNNVKNARKVISHCAENSILDEECTKCELHVDSLRGALPSNDTKKNQEPVLAVPSSISLKPSHSENGDKSMQEDDEKKKREDEARKKRMAAMKASQRRASAFSVSIEQSRAKAVTAPDTTVNPPANLNRTVTDPTASEKMKPPPARFIPPPVQQPTASGDPRAQQFNTAANTPSLYNSAPNDTKIETTANSSTSLALQNDYSYGQSHEPKQTASQNTYNHASSNNDRMRSHAPHDEDANDRLYRSHQDSQEDRNNRYNDRSSDYEKKRDARYDQSYSRSDSRVYNTSRNYSRGVDYDDERPKKRSRGSNDNERTSMNYGTSAQKGGGTEKLQSQQESTTSKYDNTGPPARAAFTAPSAGGGRGRGRGGVDNRPAWMTKGQSAPNGSTASANVGGTQPTTDPGATFTAPVASTGRGRGRGRGGVDNRPAWMTQGQSAPGNTRVQAPVVDTQQPSTVSAGEVFSAPPTGMGRGRGRGGVDNRPAWMTKGHNVQMSDTAIKPAGPPSSGSAAFGSQTADGGMGRGRGRGSGRGRGIDNRPAWMSKQDN